MHIVRMVLFSLFRQIATPRVEIFKAQELQMFMKNVLKVVELLNILPNTLEVLKTN